MYKVLKEFKGTEDGFTVIEFKVGEQVELGAALAAVALEERWVEKIEAAPEQVVEAAPEQVVEAAPEQVVEAAQESSPTETKPEAKPRHRR